MSTHRIRTPWPSSDTTIITDAGLETWLLFQQGVDLPAFAAYPLAATDDGKRLLTEYYLHYMAIAQAVDASVILETPTWRANPDWAATLGHDRAALAELARSTDAGTAARLTGASVKHARESLAHLPGPAGPGVVMSPGTDR